MAEREGFEPSVEVSPHTISRSVTSRYVEMHSGFFVLSKISKYLW